MHRVREREMRQRVAKLLDNKSARGLGISTFHSLGQRILLRDWRAQALFATPAARVPLARLVDGDLIRWSDARPEALLVLSFAHPHVIYADGLEVMSPCPARTGA